MKSFTVKEIEKEGFVFTGKEVDSPSFNVVDKQARALNVSYESLQIFKLNNGKWGIFTIKNADKFKEELMFPKNNKSMKNADKIKKLKDIIDNPNMSEMAKNKAKSVLEKLEKPEIKKPSGSIISTLIAKDIASNWYDGQWSALYSFSSTGKYVDEKFEDYKKEINKDISECSDKKECAGLKKLLKYFEYKHWEENKSEDMKKGKGMKALLKDAPKVKPDSKADDAISSLKAKAKTRKKKAVKKATNKISKPKDWKLAAIKDLRKEVDMKDLKKVPYDETDDHFNVSGEGDFVIFKTYEDAKYYAEDRVKEDIENEPELFNQDFLKKHMYVSDTDKRIIAGEQGDFYVDDIAESEPERVIEEADMEEEYNEEGADQDEVLERAKEKLKEQIYDRWYEGLDKDPIGFLVDDEGIYSLEDISNIKFLQIDSSEAAKAAVDEDGVAHFLSGYDGNQIDLAGGFVAFRTN